jgi:predicted peroxiredoxin
MTPPSRRLVVKVTSGQEAPERLSQAVTVAATAVASGVPVSLWLTGEASWLAVPGRAEQVVLPHAAPLAELRDLLLASARVTVCTQCAARREITAADLLPGAEIRGAAAFVEEVLQDDVQALVY